ncbi:MAG TPA: YeeE/YedE thiosulfate transporter family protein [Bacteroidales bacterium]|nr:YeeE/YedE thiosulfate transporter family protein [Bacteroidales bacterium]
MKKEKQEYINPYLGGFLLGLVLLASIYFSGRGLGASGAIKSFVVSVVDFVAPQHTQSAEFYKQYAGNQTSALKSWLVFEVIGVFIGAFISGIVSNRMTLKIDKSPVITSVRRLVFATIGGALFGLGAQFARGCTSGAALSGMGVLATGGFITMLAIFGTGFLFAFLFKKHWVY